MPSLPRSSQAPSGGAAPDARADPAALHPALWRPLQGGYLATAAVQPSGFADLDALLPGGGWPRSALTELLLPHPGVGEVRLLAPVLAALPGAWLFGPPAQPCAPALFQLGLEPSRFVLVQGGGAQEGAAGRALPTADLLWALEQTLRSGHAAAVLAWLPDRLPADALRRLQLAAQAHGGLAFLLRGLAAAARPSPAPLRLVLRPTAAAEALELHWLKRRGPLPEQALRLRLPSALVTRGSPVAGEGPGAAVSVSVAGASSSTDVSSAPSSSSDTGASAAVTACEGLSLAHSPGKPTR